jgi:MoxR-like ATPase
MEENQDINFDNRIPLEDLKQAAEQIKQELGKVIIGQDNFI